jgi:putative ABC transport system ATP-binding protein
LVGKPSILLADEPTGNLDSSTSLEILALIKEVHRAGQTVVMVTHEPEIAEQCHRVVRLHDGRVLSDVRNVQQDPHAQVVDDEQQRHAELGE